MKAKHEESPSGHGVKSGRMLNALVIHDSDLKSGFLETAGIQTFEIVGYRGARKEHLRYWEDHVEYWRRLDDRAHRWRASRHWPDLILVDGNFEHDRSPPSLRSKIDARGLLHGAIWIAHVLGADPAFPCGFALYSKHIPALQKDPLGVTCFGLLASMMGRAPSFEEVKRNYAADGLSDWAREVMGRQVTSGDPKDAVSRALQDYRVRFLRLVSSHAWVVPDPKSASRIYDHVQRIAKGKVEDSGNDLALRFFTARGEDTVLIRSLLADYYEHGLWDQEIIDWLAELVQHNYIEREFEPALLLLRHYVATSVRKETIAFTREQSGYSADAIMSEAALDDFERSLGKGSRRSELDRKRGLALLMWTAATLSGAFHGTREPTTTLAQTVFGWDPKQFARAIGKGVNHEAEKSEYELTYTQMVGMLKHACWPFDPAAYICVVDYLNDLKIERNHRPLACRTLWPLDE